MAYYMNQLLFTDTSGRTWYRLQREDGSTCVYYTRLDNPAHWVVFDDLDTEPEYEVAARSSLPEAAA